MDNTPRDPLITLLALLLAAKAKKGQETVIEFTPDFELDDDEFSLDEIEFDPEIDELH